MKPHDFDRMRKSRRKRRRKKRKKTLEEHLEELVARVPPELFDNPSPAAMCQWIGQKLVERGVIAADQAAAFAEATTLTLDPPEGVVGAVIALPHATDPEEFARALQRELGIEVDIRRLGMP